MKHLAYSHSRQIPLVETMTVWTHKMLPGWLRRPELGASRTNWRGVALCIVGWILALAIQAALLVALAELVEVIHGVMNLYLDLAQQQLDLTSLYVKATSV